MRSFGSFMKHLLLAIAGLLVLIAPYVIHRTVILAALVACLLVAGNQRALAWGEAGHAVIAEIADRHLTPEASHAVRDLLALENDTTLAQVASWADDIKRQRPKTRRWHYVDIPISAASYDAARDCAGGNCIIPKIAEYRAILGNKSASPEDRLEALKFVVHFIGDLHHPLHCSNNDDKAGNADKARGYSGSENLHAVWDTGIIKKAHLNEPDIPRMLDAKISAVDDAKWSQGTVIDWANESHAIAVSFIYTHMPDADGNFPPGYQSEAEPIVEKQLEKAGIRLAAALNTALQ